MGAVRPHPRHEDSRRSGGSAVLRKPIPRTRFASFAPLLCTDSSVLSAENTGHGILEGNHMRPGRFAVVSLAFHVLSWAWLVADAQENTRWVSESVHEGADGALCAELLRRLNSMSERCAVDAIETSPLFTEPPWKDLNPSEHENLIAQFEKIRQLSPSRYFASGGLLNGPEDDIYRRRAREFIADGGRLQLWRARLWGSGGQRTQSVVLMSIHVQLAHPADECPGTSSKGWLRSSFAVTSDLSAPDPDVDGAAVLYLRNVVLHDGTLYLLSPDSVFRSFGAAGLQGICRFRPKEPYAYPSSTGSARRGTENAAN